MTTTVSRIVEGDLVRHQSLGYVGMFDGETRLQNLMELPTDSVGCRVRILVDSDGILRSLEERPIIASPSNLMRLKDLPLEERHKVMIDTFRLPYVGSGPGGGRQRRKAHCWFCKSKLDSLIDRQCFKCYWILCECGSCGCGFKAIMGAAH